MSFQSELYHLRSAAAEHSMSVMIPTEHLATPPHGTEGGEPTQSALTIYSQIVQIMRDQTSEKHYCVMAA